MTNPYWGKTAGEFFLLFFHRLAQFITGHLPYTELAPDEIQIGVLIALSLSSAFVGTFLVLKKMTMLANSISHTILLGIVLAYLFLNPFSSHLHEGNTLSLSILWIAALTTALLTTILTQGLQTWAHLQEDASIGLVFTGLFALGVTLVTLFTRNAHIGTEIIMGNVDALHLDDLKLSLAILLGNLLLGGLFFKELKLTTFDAPFAKSLGISPGFFQYFLMVLVATTVTGAFRAVGVLLVLALLVGPVLTARRLTHHLSRMITLAALIGSFCTLLSVALARHLLSVYHLSLSTTGILVVCLGITYGLTLVLQSLRGNILRLNCHL